MSDYDNIYQTISSLTYRIMMDVRFNYLKPRIMDIFPQATLQRVEGGGNRASCDVMASLCQEVSRLSRNNFYRFVQAIEEDHADVAEDIRKKYREVTRGIIIPRPKPTEAVTSPTRTSGASRKPYVAQESGIKSTRYGIDGPASSKSHAGSQGLDSSSSVQRASPEPILEEQPNSCAYDEEIQEPVYQPGMSKYEQEMLKDRNKVYKMDEDCRGVCLIINNKEFKQLEHKLRGGSEHDVTALENLFKYLGFSVAKKWNKSAQEMKDWLKDQANDRKLRSVSALAVAVLTHGKEGDEFLGTDGEIVTKVELAQIFNSENCKALVGKPKLFIFQACRGAQRQGNPGSYEREGATQSDGIVAHNSDMCFFYASSAGYEAYRDNNRGSPVVKEFCARMKKQAHVEEFTKIIQGVINEFSERSVGDFVTLPDLSSQLRRDWYLNPPGPSAQ